MDNDDEIRLLLAKYIANQATEAEAKEVKRWINLHPENELYFIELYEAWQNALLADTKRIDAGKAYQSFLAKTNPLQEEEPVRRKPWGKMAVGALCVIAIGAIIILNKPVKPVIPASQVIAQKGSIKKMILSDGTTVWLNACSTLKFNADFGKTNRTVCLEGEAFFDIGHGKSNLPFLVNTRNYTIRDIGTRFNLKAYPADSFFETTVVKGEVAVESNTANNPKDENRIFLKPHQVLRIYYKPLKSAKLSPAKFSENYNDVSMLQVDSAQLNVYDGWKDNLLVFDGNRFAEMAKVLERRYNVNIEIADTSLQDIRYSGSFKNVQDIEHVLQIIRQNTPINYSIKGQIITITKSH